MTKPSNDYEEYGITPKLFEEWRSPRLGVENPSVMSNPVWRWLINSRHSAYAAANMFRSRTSSTADGPTWSFDRFGQSCTKLLDGRKVYIAGEHEDSYDPDFFIYNDIVVEEPNGSIAIYGYPKESFPPTDFHSATVVGSEIIVVGNLGYSDDRKPGTTQVLSVDTHTFSVSHRLTTGHHPGWIHEHRAVLSENGQSLLITGGKIDIGSDHFFAENIDDWLLNLETGEWTQLIHRRWPRWQIYKPDKRGNYLWHIRQALWSHRAKWDDDYSRSMSELEEFLGYRPDVFSVERLYRPDIEHKVVPERKEEYAVYRIQINGVTVRYVEEDHGVLVTVEGDLPEATVRRLVEDVQNKLSTLENSEYVAEKID